MKELNNPFVVYGYKGPKYLKQSKRRCYIAIDEFQQNSIANL